MNEIAEKLFGGLAETVKESLSNAPSQIGAELMHQVGAGSHEIAAALFNGSGFVMYPRGTKDDVGIEPEHGLDNQAMEQPQQQQERGGRSM
jgi:hypothetical protein